MNADNLKAGSWLFARGSEGKAVPVRLATLFRPKGGDQAYGLIAAPHGQQVNVQNNPVYASQDLNAGALLGHLTEGEVLASDKAINTLFSVFSLDPRYSTHLKTAPHSEHLISNAFGTKPMRLRQAPKIVPGKGWLAQYLVHRPKGRLIGDIHRAQLRVGNSFVTLERGGLAKSFGNRAFAGAGDSGAPILNKRRALVGFVVGKFQDDEVLFVPAEDLAERHKIEFLTPDAPDLPAADDAEADERRAAG